jgi:hypothetical protein
LRCGQGKANLCPAQSGARFKTEDDAMMIRSLALAAAALLAFSAAQAASGDTVTGVLKACRAETNATARLACFDRLVAGLDAEPPVAFTAPVPAPAPVASAPAVAPPAPVASPKKETSWYNPTDWFGSDAPKPARPMAGNPTEFGGENLARPADDSSPAPLDHITATVTRVTINALGKFTVTLANGQVWRQGESDTGVARFKNDGKETVTITRGFLDAYSLKIDGKWGTYKVKRIK